MLEKLAAKVNADGGEAKKAMQLARRRESWNAVWLTAVYSAWQADLIAIGKHPLIAAVSCLPMAMGDGSLGQSIRIVPKHDQTIDAQILYVFSGSSDDGTVTRTLQTVDNGLTSPGQEKVFHGTAEQIAELLVEDIPTCVAAIDSLLVAAHDAKDERLAKEAAAKRAAEEQAAAQRRAAEEEAARALAEARETEAEKPGPAA